MARFKSALETARRTSEAEFQRALSAASRSSSLNPMQVFGGSASGMARAIGESRQQPYDALEQLRHFRNQVFTSVRPIAQRIAGQPIRLAKIGHKPKAKQNRIAETRQCEIPYWLKSFACGFGMKANEDLTIVDQNPILDALAKPAPSLPGWSDWALKSFTIVNLEMTGRAYWWFPVVNGRKEIWPLPSSWVRPNHEPQLFTSWMLRFNGVGEEKPIPIEQIAPFWYPNPENPLLGLGPLEAGATSIMVEEFVIEAQKRAFQLGIHPSALVYVGSQRKVDGKPVAPRARKFQREQLTNAIRQRWVGMAHYGEPLLLDALINDVKPWGNKPNEMDFGTNADGARARVEQVFGTNPYTAGASGLSSRAESAESDRHFVANTVNPKIELLSKTLTIVVLPQFDSSGQYILFIEPARAHDAEMEQKEWEVGLDRGTVTINQYNTQVLRQPPVPWGDAIILKPGYSIVPVTQLANGFINPRVNENATPTDGSKSLSGSKVLDDEFYDAYAERWLKSHESNETPLKDAVQAFLKDQVDDVATKLEALHQNSEASAAEIAADVFDAKQWDQNFRDAIRPAFARSVAAGASHEWRAFSDSKSFKAVDYGFGMGFGVDLPADMLEAVKNAVDAALSKDYWSDIQETTATALRDALKQSLDEGADMPTTIKRVRQDVFEGDIARERAENIARSEVTYALNAGQDVARQKLAADGIVSGKEWLATFDGRTRQTHYEANGQVIDVDANFQVGGYPAKYPGDPSLPAKERCRCRCVASSVTVFTKRTRLPIVKLKRILPSGCEVHG